MTNGNEHSGELLEVRDSSVVILTGGRLAIGKYSDIVRMEFGEFKSDAFGPTKPAVRCIAGEGKEGESIPVRHHRTGNVGVVAGGESDGAGRARDAQTLMARRSRLLAALGGVALCGTFLATRAPMGLSAKTYSPEAFVADARKGTRRYLSQQEAVNDGFTRVGVEFPAMGEHWVSFARVMEDSFVAKRPSVLIYTNTVGGPTLAGVAYSKLLTPGGTPPAFFRECLARAQRHSERRELADRSFSTRERDA